MKFIINPFTRKLDAYEQDTTGTDVETLTGDSGGAVAPDGAANIDILGGPGIDVVGIPGSNKLTVSYNGGVEATGTTVGAVTTDLITKSRSEEHTSELQSH